MQIHFQHARVHLIGLAFIVMGLVAVVVVRFNDSNAFAIVVKGTPGTPFELLKIYCESKKDASIKLLLRTRPIQLIAQGQAVIEWSDGEIRCDKLIAKLVEATEEGNQKRLATLVAAEAIGNVQLNLKIEVQQGRKALVQGKCERLELDPARSQLIMTGAPQLVVEGIAPEVPRAVGKAGRIVVSLETGEVSFETGAEKVTPEVNVQFKRSSERVNVKSESPSSAKANGEPEDEVKSDAKTKDTE